MFILTVSRPMKLLSYKLPRGSVSADGRGNGEISSCLNVGSTPYLQVWEHSSLSGKSVSFSRSLFLTHRQGDVQRAPGPEKHSRFCCNYFVPCCRRYLSGIPHSASQVLLIKSQRHCAFLLDKNWHWQIITMPMKMNQACFKLYNYSAIRT